MSRSLSNSRSSSSEAINASAPRNDSEHGGEEQSEGCNATQSRQWRTDEVEDEDGHGRQKRGQDCTQYIDDCVYSTVGVVV